MERVQQCFQCFKIFPESEVSQMPKEEKDHTVKYICQECLIGIIEGRKNYMEVIEI